MHPIIYDVAVSIDGFISGPSGDISRFAREGQVVVDYHARMAEYATAIMGRNTYEFGFAFGLEPGQNPYPHMRSIIFFQSLELPSDRSVEVCQAGVRKEVMRLKSNSVGPIYLCGGGQFAGWLLKERLIDRIILKRAPCILGGGVQLFGETGVAVSLKRVASKSYEDGYVLEEFVVV
jgi:dihydrofolate reductase